MTSMWIASCACVRQAMKTEEILDGGGHFAEMRAEGDLSKAKRCLPAALIEAASITGNETQVTQRLAEYADLGVTHVFLNRSAFRQEADRIDVFLATVSDR